MANKINLSAYNNKTKDSNLTHTEWNELITTIQNTINNMDVTNGANASNSSFFVNGVSTSPNVNGEIILEYGREYVLEGTLYGRIVININEPLNESELLSLKNTRLTLNGVNIINNLDGNYGIRYNISDSILDDIGYKGLVITLEKDTINNIFCNNVQDRIDGQSGCITSSKTLKIQGVGYLNLYNKGGHGLKGSKVWVIGSKIFIDTNHDGIHGGKLIEVIDSYIYANKCNDVLGTGENGYAQVWESEIITCEIDGDIVDIKGEELQENILTINSTIGNNVKINHDENYSVSSDEFANKISSMQYKTLTSDNLEVFPLEGLEEIVIDDTIGTGSKIYLEGVITIPIIINPTVSDVTLYLNGVFIETLNDIPCINYKSKSSKLKIVSSKGTVNIIKQIKNTDLEPPKFNDDNLQYYLDLAEIDYDAIKSENNISIEVKNESILYINSTLGDGIDSGDLKITDTNGVLIITDCGGRGIKSACLSIGPNVESSKSMLTKYYTDPSDTENYSYMEGSVVCKNNCKIFPESLHINDTGTNLYKLFGYADIYCRNGKATKGTFGTTETELEGIVITENLTGVVDININKNHRIYYQKSCNPEEIINDLGTTINKYKVISSKKLI